MLRKAPQPKPDYGHILMRLLIFAMADTTAALVCFWCDWTGVGGGLAGAAVAMNANALSVVRKMRRE